MVDNCDVQRPVVLMLLHRPGDVPIWNAHDHEPYADTVELSLEGLTQTGCRSLVRNMLGEGGNPIPGVEDVVISSSGGNPFFLEELLAELVESGALARSGRGDGWELQRPLSRETATLPSSIDGLIRARIDRLPDRSRKALQCASVLEPRFTERIFGRVWSISWGSEADRGVPVELLERDYS